jgi:hypothetical protein
MGDSGMIRTHIEKHNEPVVVAVLGTPCVIPPRNNNRNSKGLHFIAHTYNSNYEIKKLFNISLCKP